MKENHSANYEDIFISSKVLKLQKLRNKTHSKKTSLELELTGLIILGCVRKQMKPRYISQQSHL